MNDNEIKKHLGLRIKSLRKDKNLTQTEFCDIIGLEQANLSNIENGKNYPDIKTLCMIILKMNINPNFLLGFLGDNNSNYSNLDTEIMELLLNMTDENKQHLKNFIMTMK